MWSRGDRVKASWPTEDGSLRLRGGVNAGQPHIAPARNLRVPENSPYWVYSHLAKPRQQLIAPHPCGTGVPALLTPPSSSSVPPSVEPPPASPAACCRARIRRRSFSDSITLLASTTPYPRCCGLPEWWR
eukprot:scaffold77648_cov109-Phaeocystis_antarctica.AAC.1